MIGVRHSYGFVKSQFEKEGYKLLSKKYINSKGRLDFICPNGHIHYSTWDHWQSGCRCGRCARNVKFDIDFIKEQFRKEGYTLITKEYINQKQKLGYICPEGHRNVIMWSDWYYGNCRCSICKGIKMRRSGNHQWRGGVSFEPYDVVWKTTDIRKSIKERDGYICQNPSCWHGDGLASQLTVHHIDYNKKNCGEDNLITLCRSCNARSNKNTDYYIDLYRTIMSNKYGYNYNKKEINL